MILVTVGTIHFPFKRLLDFCYSHFLNDTQEEIVIQTGTYPLSSKKNITTKPFFTHQQMINFYKKARIIIAAAGEATMFEILQYSKNKPILIPRLKKYHEHVDDQQLEIALKLNKLNLAIAILDIEEIIHHISKQSNIPNIYANKAASPEMINFLKNITDSVIDK
jgi:UDP-N-acetylglucosamine transferase subunit ALG13